MRRAASGQVKSDRQVGEMAGRGGIHIFFKIFGAECAPDEAHISGAVCSPDFGSQATTSASQNCGYTTRRHGGRTRRLYHVRIPNVRHISAQ